MKRLKASLVPIACWALAACQPELNQPERLDTVRVLAVKKSSPYPRPGSDVDLGILWYDGRVEPGEGDDTVQVLWLAGCVNPPGDLYYLCYLQLAYAGLLLESPGFSPGDGITLPAPSTEQPGAPPEPVDLVRTGAGSTFTYRVPSGIVASHPPPDNPEQPPYGVAYVFFTACAGQVRLLPEWRALAERIAQLFLLAGDPSSGDASRADPREELGRLIGEGGLPATFPLGCYSSTEQLLGPDHFVAGYSTLYAYTEIDNQNPVVRGLRVAGNEFGVNADPGQVCFGEACIPSEPGIELPSSQDCADYAACIPTCGKADPEQCPTYPFEVQVDEADVEDNPLSGTTEQMWVQYYTSAGSLDGDTQLVADPVRGVRDGFSSDLRAPQQPGPFFAWGVVHDARGGVNWARATLLATDAPP